MHIMMEGCKRPGYRGWSAGYCLLEERTSSRWEIMHLFPCDWLSRAVIQRECHVWKINGVTGASREVWQADNSTMNIYSLAFLCVGGSSAYPLLFEFDTYSILCVQMSELCYHNWCCRSTLTTQLDMFISLWDHNWMFLFHCHITIWLLYVHISHHKDVLVSLWHHSWMCSSYCDIIIEN